MSSKIPPTKLVQATLTYTYFSDLAFTLPLSPRWLSAMYTRTCHNLPQFLELSLPASEAFFPFRPNVTSSERPSLATQSNIEVSVIPYLLPFFIFLHCTCHQQICTMSVLLSMYSQLSRTIPGT